MSFQCNVLLRRLVNLTEIQTTSLPVFELQSKTLNVLSLFRICRKSFTVTCYITLSFVATLYCGKLSETIVQCNISCNYKTAYQIFLYKTLTNCMYVLNSYKLSNSGSIVSYKKKQQICLIM